MKIEFEGTNEGEYMNTIELSTSEKMEYIVDNTERFSLPQLKQLLTINGEEFIDSVFKITKSSLEDTVIEAASELS